MLKWKKIEYEDVVVSDQQQLITAIKQHYSHPYSDISSLVRTFNGTITIYKKKVLVLNTVSLINFLQRDLPNFRLSPSKEIELEIIQWESWIDQHIFYIIFVQGIIPYEIMVFVGNLSLVMERIQSANSHLLEILIILNKRFKNCPWIIGEQFTICDISLFYLMVGILRKNPSILKSYEALEDWYKRISVKKDLISFL